MEIKRVGSQPSSKGPADWFTGTVRIDPLFRGKRSGAHLGCASVTFEPGARTAWHTHPLGQTLIVTAGCWPGAARGRSDRGNPSRRCGLVPARRQALAWGHADYGYDAYRHSRSTRRQGRRMDGEGQRRAIPGLIQSHAGACLRGSSDPRVISRPCARPKTAPSSRANAMPSNHNDHRRKARCSETIHQEDDAPRNQRRHGADRRSMPPEMMTKHMPTAMMPIKAVRVSTFIALSKVAKSGLSRVPATHSSARLAIGPIPGSKSVKRSGVEGRESHGRRGS